MFALSDIGVRTGRFEHGLAAIAGRTRPGWAVETDVAAFSVAPALRREPIMNMTLSLAPLVSLLAGILILVVPRLLNYIVAIYLIVIGLLGLFGAGNLHLR